MKLGVKVHDDLISTGSMVYPRSFPSLRIKLLLFPPEDLLVGTPLLLRRCIPLTKWSHGKESRVMASLLLLFGLIAHYLASKELFWYTSMDIIVEVSKC
ncbi:MAG: hypothetical protein J7K88_08880 [Candidatus Fermentibacteraceae bacterium]|nr:hypothetical protein [Candidatus Fermentibacteraceae bacterium]